MAWTERYVSASAGGGGAGTSAGDPWTLAEGLAGATAGMRLNVLAGTYGTAGTATAAGTAAAPICIQGYVASVGDLAAPTRTLGGTGPIDTTGFPSITAQMTLKNYWWVRNISMTADVASYLLDMVQFGILTESVISNTNATSSGSGVRVGTNTIVHDNDIDGYQCIIATSGAVTPKIHFNRLFCTGNASSTRGISLVNARPSHVVGNQIWSQYSNGEGIRIWSTTQHNSIINNTIFDMAYGIRHDAADEGTTIAGNLIWKCVTAVEGAASTALLLSRNGVGGGTTTYSTIGDAFNADPVTISSNPFRASSNASDSDFRLNKAPGGGMACRRSGMMGNDIGALQDQIRRLRGL